MAAPEEPIGAEALPTLPVPEEVKARAVPLDRAMAAHQSLLRQLAAAKSGNPST